jgi:ATP-dependent Zn protease
MVLITALAISRVLRLQANSRAAVAVHEAGHAVVARVLGIPAYDVTIVEGDDLLGAASFDNPVYDWSREDGSKIKAANNFASAAYAGVAAEREILNSGVTSDSDDHRKAQDCLAWAGAVKGASFVGDDRFDRHEANLRKKAAALVHQHRSAIERLASALLERETLSGAEVDALLNP